MVVLGTTGEYPSFSMAERKKVAETALKHRSGLSIIVSGRHPQFPRDHRTDRSRRGQRRRRPAVIPPFYYKKPAARGLIKYYSLIFERSKIPINLYHIPGTSAVPITTSCCTPGALSQPRRHQGLHRRRRGIRGVRQGVPEAEHEDRDGQQSQAGAGGRHGRDPGRRQSLHQDSAAAVFAAHRAGKRCRRAAGNKLRAANAAAAARWASVPTAP